MKKFLLLFAFIVSAIAAKALTATVYVKADKAPFLYGWYTVSGKETKINGAWPGKAMTQTTVKKDKLGNDVTFWYQTFETTAAFNIIFNNGNTNLMKQTGNITNISSDRYFTYDGATKYTDITEDFGVEVPDVEIQSVALISALNKWDGLADLFTEVEKDKKYIFPLDLTNEEVEEDFFVFKFIVNSSAYLDWNTTGMTKVDPNEWMEEDTGLGGGNIGIDLEAAGTRTILFTLEFAGGKDIYKGWTLTVGEIPTGVNAIHTVESQKFETYNLAGQRVEKGYRGLVIKNGKKVIVK